MNKIKKLRIDIDKLVFIIESMEFESQESNRALALVKTKLQESKMWCGKVLEGMGKPLPEEYRGYCSDREENIKRRGIKK